MQFAIDKLGINDDILVVAGDNVLDFSLVKFVEYAKEKGASCIMRYYEPEFNRLLKCGVVETDESDKILSMTEKSPTPATYWCCPPFYFYTAADAKYIAKGIKSGCPTDAPGSFAAWLSTQTTVYAMEMPGKRYDIGTVESYEKVNREYKGIC